MSVGDGTSPDPGASNPASAGGGSVEAAGRIGRRSVLAAAGTVTAAVFTSRVLGLIRESLFAALFGAGKFADAFVLAFRIPNLLRELFAEGSMSSAFVPTFTLALTRDGRDRAYHLGNLLISGLMLITGLLAVLGIVFAPAIVDVMAPGFGGDPDKRELAISAARIMMPFLPLITCAAAVMGMLNAQRRFFLPAVAPAMFNVACIVVGVILWMQDTPPDRAVLGWSVGSVIGAAVQFGVQVPSLYRLGWRFWPTIRGFFADEGIRRIGRLMGPAVVGLAAVQINILVNSIFASNLGDGPMAQLNYAWRLFYLPLGLFGVAIATVTTTTVAEEAARGDYVALRNRVAHALKLTWMLTVPSAIGLMAVSVPAICLIYQRGAFGAEDTLATAYILVAYAVGLAPYSSIKMVAPAFYALDRPRVPMLASITAVVVNVTFNALTYRKLGAVGLAMGTALGAMANITILIVSLRVLIGSMRGQGLVPAAIRVVAASLLTGGAAFGLWWAIDRGWAGAGGSFWITGLGRVLSLVVPAGVGVAVYLATCQVFRLREITELTEPLARRLGRRPASRG
ncbi:MAG: murein biosynthesis integral membrane protein MurJ [Phycisphaerae bacterium]|nr:murein biosynthesis integral membrane protein MurJ [Phycisphaerae bacterium]